MMGSEDFLKPIDDDDCVAHNFLHDHNQTVCFQKGKKERTRAKNTFACFSLDIKHNYYISDLVSASYKDIHLL